MVELRSRTIRKIEERIPNIFRELSVLNEAGLNILEALKVLSASEIGVISKEINVVKKRIEWGTTIHKAFTVLGLRIRSGEDNSNNNEGFGGISNIQGCIHNRCKVCRFRDSVLEKD